MPVNSPHTADSPMLRPVSIPRLLPVSGQVLVQPGQPVRPESIVAQADLLPAVRWVVPLAQQLGVAAADLAACLLVDPGAFVHQGQVLARVAAGNAGSTRDFRSPISGVLEAVDFTGGRIVVREAVDTGRSPVVLFACDWLRCRPRQLPSLFWRTKGDRVRRGEVLAGAFPGPLLLAPVSGQVSELDWQTGEIAITPIGEQLSLQAALPGTVADVDPGSGCRIAGQAWTIPGRFRFGTAASGRLQVLAPAAGAVSDRQLTPEVAGRVLVVGAQLTGAVLFKARALGVAGLIAGGAQLADLLSACGNQGGRSAIAAEAPGTMVVLTEGFGHCPMRQAHWRLLQSREGQWAGLFAGCARQPAQILVFPA